MSLPNISALLHRAVTHGDPESPPSADAPPTDALPSITILRGTRVDPLFDQLPASTVRAEVLRALQNGTARTEFLLDTPAGTLALRVSGIVTTRHGSIMMIDWSHAAILASARELLLNNFDRYSDAVMRGMPRDDRASAQADWRATGEAYQQILRSTPGPLLHQTYVDERAGELDFASGETMLLAMTLEAMPLRMRRERILDIATEIFTTPDDAHSELYNIYVGLQWNGLPSSDTAALYDHAALMAAHPDSRYAKMVHFDYTRRFASLCAYIHFAPVGQCEKLDRASPHFDPELAARYL